MNTITLDTYKYNLSGSIKAIASKSVAHRLLIASAFSDRITEIECLESSADISATVSCLNSLGAHIEKENGVFTVVPIKEPIKNASIDCNESGSTLRFLLPVIGVLGNGASIMSHGRLPQRPLSPLYEEMQKNGVTLSPQGVAPLICSGKMSGGIYTIAGNISSQYITGLLFALPMASCDSKIIITGKLESRPYVNITLQVLRDFGITINETSEGEFIIPGNQKYLSKGRYVVEGDWSNAAFFLCAGAINPSGITTTNLNMNSLQGDKKIVDILSDFGATILYSDNDNNLTDIYVARGNLHGIEVDASDIPDLVPIIAAVASVCEGTTEIRNIERLRIKESDRVKTVIDTLSKLGAHIYEADKKIIIYGSPKLSGGTIDSSNDHRIAMMAAIISSQCQGPVTINDPMAVAKSYPDFYSDFSTLMQIK